MIDRRQLLGYAAATAAFAPAVLRARPLPDTASWVPTPAQVDAIEALARTHQIPGASAAVFENGAVAWQWTYGVQSTASGVPVNRNTLFQAASLSKPVTAYVTMQMIEAGLLRLDDRLIDFHRPDLLSDHAWSSQVTVRHALTHSTGLPNWPAREEDIVIEPEFEPGTAYSYSGQAYQWVQAAIERIAGTSLQHLCEQYLFAPAGLDDMAMLWLPGRAPREALGHVLNDDRTNSLEPMLFDQVVGARLQQVSQRWQRPLASFTLDDYRAAYRLIDNFGHERVDAIADYRWDRPQTALANAAASLRTTPADYARFLALMLPGPSADGLLSATARDSMLTVQTERPPNRYHLPAGIGWGLERYEGRLVYHHWGMNGQSYVSNALGDPALRRTLCFMCNGSSGGPFIDQAASLLTGGGYRAVS